MTVLFKPILALHIIIFSNCRNYWGGGGKTICLPPPPQYFHWGRLPPPPPGSTPLTITGHYIRQKRASDILSLHWGIQTLTPCTPFPIIRHCMHCMHDTVNIQSVSHMHFKLPVILRTRDILSNYFVRVAVCYRHHGRPGVQGRAPHRVQLLREDCEAAWARVLWGWDEVHLRVREEATQLPARTSPQEPWSRW